MSFAVLQGIGVTELLIVLGVVLVIFGPKRLPMLGRQLGSSMREFKDGITRKAHEDDEAQPEERPALESPQGSAAEPVSEDRVTGRDH